MNIKEYLDITYLLVMIMFTPLAFIGLIIYCYFTYKLWNTQVEANKINAANAYQQTLTNQTSMRVGELQAEKEIAEIKEREVLTNHQFQRERISDIEKLGKLLPSLLEWLDKKAKTYIKSIVHGPSPNDNSDKEQQD